MVELKNKKAQLGITITWMVAFVVIFFIMIVFVATTAIAVTKKQLNKNEIYSIESGFIKINSQGELIRFLNSEVEIDGKKVRVSDEVLILLEPYLNEEFLKKINAKDVNKIYVGRALAKTINYAEIFRVQEINVDEENKKLEILRQNLDDGCLEYIFEFPFGYFYSYGGQKAFSADISQLSKGADVVLGDYVVINILNKGQKINFKLKSRYIC